MRDQAVFKGDRGARRRPRPLPNHSPRPLVLGSLATGCASGLFAAMTLAMLGGSWPLCLASYCIVGALGIVLNACLVPAPRRKVKQARLFIPHHAFQPAQRAG